MANQADMLRTAVNRMNSFLLSAKRFAAPILREFSQLSEPITIDTDDIKMLNCKLDKIRATIFDAENKREITDESVKLWLSELRDVEYMAVDILEEFESSCRFHEICLEIATSKSSKLVEVSVFPPPPDLSCLSRKISVMTERCREIADDRRQFRLKEGDGKRREEGIGLPPSSSIPDGQLFGREEVLQNIVRVLTCDVNSCSVVPITGMPGVGKTALAQHVYNHAGVESCFERMRIWVCVSEDFDVRKISRAIIEHITKQPCRLTELDPMQQIIANLFKDQRFLLVLDNVWNVNLNHWETLLKPLKIGTIGGKIIVTSCSDRVAKIIGTCKPFRLSCLSNNDCKSICLSHAFRPRSTDVPKNVLSFCDDAIEWCKGLPLAAKDLGGLLCSASCQDSIETLLQDEPVFYDELIKRILPVLRRRYDNLPAHLKHCFAYCSLFPRGYLFEKEQLVRLWMAQGFIVADEASQGKDIEATGRKYFDDLAGLSFFELSPFYDEIEERYEMHNLIHELAYSISGNEYSKVDHLDKLHHRTRHSSLALPVEEPQNLIELQPFEGQDIRTFLFVGQLKYSYDLTAFNVKIASNLFERLECLRALDLRNTGIDRLPNSIANLKHLHYLCLENTRIKNLPESLCRLYKLQTLDLRHCYHLEKLPSEMKHLLSLRHLELPLTEYFNLQLPSGIGKLINLQTLPIFSVGNHASHCKLAELKGLTSLRGELIISGLNNVCDVHDAEESHLKSKKLRKLTLYWFRSYCSKYVDKDYDGKTAYLILEKLQPHHNLEELCIRNYSDIKFPMWIADPRFSKLSSIYLQECAECNEIPPLGQLPSLKYLTIQMMKAVQSIGREFCGSTCINTKGFPKLERLEFAKMSEWEEWGHIVDGAFPCLRILILNGCPKLRKLPQLDKLRELRIHNCEQLACLPVFSALQCLRMTGFQNLERLQLAELSALETLELDCCERLASMNLQDLVSLKLLKITRCPVLDFSQEVQLPSKLEVVYVDGSLSSQHLWSSYGFQLAKEKHLDGIKLVRTLQPVNILKRPFVAGDFSSETDNSWYRNIKKAI